jgi:hypothetical protein
MTGLVSELATRARCLQREQSAFCPVSASIEDMHYALRKLYLIEGGA